MLYFHFADCFLCYTETFYFDVLVFVYFFYFVAHAFSSVQSLSCVRLFAIPWTAAHKAFLSITNS